ncbi:hypothetical protein BMETH_1093_0 [methanotrophic bacterial endosymbiont of Bathymodiolus sp.]|nr:hypothetical protein BMETH_1093_0 [methanotrophic bacterial endosymbiont of Bathymodiolus sp.]
MCVSRCLSLSLINCILFKVICTAKIFVPYRRAKARSTTRGISNAL